MIYPSGIPISLSLTYQLSGEVVPFVGTLTHRLVSAGVVVETTEAITTPRTEVAYSFNPPLGVEGSLTRYQLSSFGVLSGQTVLCRKHFSVATTDYLTLGCDEVRTRLGLQASEVSDDYIPVEATYIDLMAIYSGEFHTERYGSALLNSKFNKLVLLFTALTVLQVLPTLLTSREETDNHVFIRLGKGDYSGLAKQLEAEAEAIQLELQSYQNVASYDPSKTLFLIGSRVNPLTGS